jgi:hypothetical protein
VPQVEAGQVPDDTDESSRRRWLFLVALGVTVAAAAGLALGLLTPPHSGPYCRSDCIGYPYSGGAQFVPHDFWWQYPAALTAALALVFVIVLPVRQSAGARLTHRMATVLAALASGVLITDYGIQLMVVQPSLVRGETDGLGLWSQLNPHGVFIALESLGYLLLALAFSCLGAAMTVRARLDQAARVVFVVGGALPTLALIGYVVAYQADLDYRFEVTGIAVDWMVLIITGVLIAVASRNRPPRPGRSG